MLVGYGYMVDFFTGFAWWRTEPHDELVSGGNYCLARPGELYAVYAPHGGAVTVSLHAGQYRVDLLNATTGEQTHLPQITVSGSSWTSPDCWLREAIGRCFCGAARHSLADAGCQCGSSLFSNCCSPRPGFTLREDMIRSIDGVDPTPVSEALQRRARLHFQKLEASVAACKEKNTMRVPRLVTDCRSHPRSCGIRILSCLHRSRSLLSIASHPPAHKHRGYAPPC